MWLFLGKRMSPPSLALTKTLVPRPLYVIPVTSITRGKCDPSRLLRATLGTPSTLPSFYCQHSGATLPRRFRSVLKTVRCQCDTTLCHVSLLRSSRHGNRNR